MIRSPQAKDQALLYHYVSLAGPGLYKHIGHSTGLHLSLLTRCGAHMAFFAMGIHMMAGLFAGFRAVMFLELSAIRSLYTAKSGSTEQQGC